MAAADIRLRGAHNRENAMAAAAVCLARGVDAEAVREGLATFAGVPHRLEEIAVVDGVTYVNDSKATNVASAEVGIRSFERGVHLIAGGRGKGSDYAPLAAPVQERCAGVYLIGETAAALRERARADRRRRCTTPATSSGPSRRRTRRRVPATSCCSPRAARPTTSTAPTRSAETTSAGSSSRSQ